MVNLKINPGVPFASSILYCCDHTPHMLLLHASLKVGGAIIAIHIATAAGLHDF